MPVPIPTLIWKTGVPLPPEPSGRGVPAYNIQYIGRTWAGITLAGSLNRPSPNEPGFTWGIDDITGGRWSKQFYKGARAGGIFSNYMATSQGGIFAVTAMDAAKRWYNASPETNALFLRPVYKLDGTTVLYASTGINDQNPIEYSAHDRFFPIRGVRNAIPQSGSERIYGMAIGPSGLIATSVLSNYAKKVKTWPPTGVGGPGPVTYHTINPTSAGILDLQYGGGWYIAVDRTQPRLYCSRDGENWTTVTHPSFSRLAWNNSRIVYGAGIFLLGSAYQYSLSNNPTGSWTTIDMGGSFNLAGTDHSKPLFVDNSANNKLSYFVFYSGTNSGVVNSVSTVIYATLKNEQTSSFFSSNWELLPRTWTVNQALNRGNIYTNANNLISYSSTNDSVLEVRSANRFTDPNPGWYFTAKARGTAIIRAYASGNNIFEPLDEQVGVTVLGINQTAPYGITSSVASGSVYSIPPATDQGLTLTYQSSDPNVAQIINNTSVRILRGGQSTITASNNGNTAYNPFTQSIIVSTPRYNQFLNLSIANDISPGYRINLPFQTDGGLNVTYQVTPSNIATIQGNVLTIVGCGAGTLTATNAGSAGYFPLNQNYTLNNTKCNQGVSVSVPGNVFKSQTYSLNSNTDVGLPVSYTFSNPTMAQILNNGAGQTTGLRFTETGVGRLNWTNPGSAQYTSVSGSLLITSSKFSQSINFSVPQIISLGTVYALETGTNAGLPITWSSSNTGIARIINNSSLIVTGCGAVQITASQIGNANYAPLMNTYARTSPRLQQNATISVPAKVAFGQKYLVPDFTNQGLQIKYTSLNSGVARIIKQ